MMLAHLLFLTLQSFADLYHISPNQYIEFKFYNFSSKQFQKAEVQLSQGSAEFSPELKRIYKGQLHFDSRSFKSLDPELDKWIKIESTLLDVLKYPDFSFHIPYMIKTIHQRFVEASGSLYLKGKKFPINFAVQYVGLKKNKHQFLVTGRFNRQSINLTAERYMDQFQKTYSDDIQFFLELNLEKKY